MSRQPTKTFCSAIVAILSTLVSCGGRIHENPGRHIDRSSAGLVAAQPALLVFGAIWCKPCRREIHDLNKAHAIYREQLGIVGMTVEGPEPGQIIQDLDLVKFRTPDGEMPTYSIHPDPNWKIFDSLLPESDHLISI